MVYLFLAASELLLLLSSPFRVFAQNNCNPSIPGDCPAGLNDLQNLFARILSLASGAAFLTLLVILVLAGVKYITSAGEPKAVQAAHQTILWAILGIMFMVIGWLALQLIATFTGISALTSFNLKVLCIPGIPGC